MKRERKKRAMWFALELLMNNELMSDDTNEVDQCSVDRRVWITDILL